MATLTHLFLSSTAVGEGDTLSAIVRKRSKRAGPKEPVGKIGSELYAWCQQQLPGITDIDLGNLVGYSASALDDWKNARHDPQKFRMPIVKQRVLAEVSRLQKLNVPVVPNTHGSSDTRVVELASSSNPVKDGQQMTPRQRFEGLCNGIKDPQHLEQAIDALIQVLQTPLVGRGLRSGGAGGSSQ